MSKALRHISALPFAKAPRAAISSDYPVFRSVSPAELLVEGEYQRNLSKKSMRLIGRLIEHWDWCAMKPPVCAETEDGRLVVIDGQHTAIAAVSHGKIPKIPVFIVKAASLRERAHAFVRQNVDRVQLTHVQIYHALLVANDPVAVAVGEACRRSGVVVRRSNPSCGVWGKNETVAVGSLLQVAERKGVAGLSRVLKILTGANRTPIAALEIRAVAEVIFDKQLRDNVTDYELTTAIQRRSPDGWYDFGKARGKKHGMPSFKALARWWAKAGVE